MIHWCCIFYLSFAYLLSLFVIITLPHWVLLLLVVSSLVLFSWLLVRMVITVLPWPLILVLVVVVLLLTAILVTLVLSIWMVIIVMTSAVLRQVVLLLLGRLRPASVLCGLRVLGQRSRVLGFKFQCFLSGRHLLEMSGRCSRNYSWIYLWNLVNSRIA